MSAPVFKVQRLELPQVPNAAWSQMFSPEDERHDPFPFQARMTEHVKCLRAQGGGFILLKLPTGSGKTRAMIMPALQLRENMIAVYPTNALIEDQERQIKPDAKRFGFKVSSIHRFHVSEVKAKNNFDSKSRALYELLLSDELGKQKNILLTNPDILNLVRHGRYGKLSKQQLYEILQAYPIIAFDELHVYDVKQVAAILHFTHWVLAQRPHVFIISTATMPTDLRERLKRPVIEEKLDDQTAHADCDRVQILSNLNLQIVGVDKWGGAEWAEQHLDAIKQWGDDGGCVIIFDSIGESISAYAQLRNDLGKNTVGLVIGAVDPESRKQEITKPIVVGNNAIRVGIDFVKRNAVVYAFSAADALQGLGRVGRGHKAKESNAVLLAPEQTADVLNAHLPELIESLNGNLTRELLTCCFAQTFPKYEDFSAYLRYYAALEAMLAQSETWTAGDRLIEELFGVTEGSLIQDIERLRGCECVPNAFVTFRGDTQIGIAVKDLLMEQHGYFPFRIENPYRVFRRCTVIKNYLPRDFARLAMQDLKWKSTGERFLTDLEERKEFVLGYAEIEWSRKRRNVTINCRQPNIWQHRNKLCWTFCDGRNCFHWQFVVESRDKRLLHLRDTVNEHLDQHKIPFIVFSPSTFALPPLFYDYLLYRQQHERVAFGGDALLVSSLFPMPSASVPKGREEGD